MDIETKRLVYNLLEIADLNEIDMGALKELLKRFGKTVDMNLLMKSLDWAMNIYPGGEVLSSYMWFVVCVDILGLKGTVDDYYSPNMTFEEYFEINDSYDYEKDYDEEDFRPISKEELLNLDKKDEISKYINGNEMVNLPPKDLFKDYCVENEEVDLTYGKHDIHIDYYNDYYLNVDGKDWIGDFDRIYSVLENLDAELEKVMSEEEKAQVELEKTKDDIINRIGPLNADSTVKDIAKIESSIEFYSDYYKDYNGYRPRSDIGEFYRAIERNASKALAEFEALSWDEKVKLMTE